VTVISDAAQAGTPEKASETPVKDSGSRNWRNDMTDALLASQRADGSWVNSADRWQEGQPELVTLYALLALEEVLKPVTQSQ
jgi:hypothetical protein